jgi:streptogramin lyase
MPALTPPPTPRFGASSIRQAVRRISPRRSLPTAAVIFMAAAGVFGQHFDEYPVPTPSSQMLGITNGPDGNVWFTEQLGKRVGRITPDGTITEFPIPGTVVSPQAITTGPDGNLWFADFVSIGMVTPAGVFQHFPVPSQSLPAYGITAGPDGNVWFTLSNSDHQRIGRITPSGVITEFPVFGGTVQLRGLITGPDGLIWFTDPLTNQVGKMTTAGAVTLYPMPAGVTGPFEIATGPDGNLWFTSGFHIGRITTDGAVTTFANPGGDAPRGMVAGPDGNMWYTESVGNHIGRITMDGVMTEFTIPTITSGPLDIAAGADGGLWFIESHANQIGRVATGPCDPDGTTLCLTESRFQVRVDWQAVHQGTSGTGQAVPMTGDTGYFWFFQPTNVELVVKVLDARSLNGKFWVFYGALSNVAYTITVTDLETQQVRTYVNPQDTMGSFADTGAFPIDAVTMPVDSAAADRAVSRRLDLENSALGAAARKALTRASASQRAACVSDPTSLCLTASRFRVEVDWRAVHQGTSGEGHAVSMTSDTGYFWFFRPSNVELVVKVLDARSLNGEFWVFYGALSNVEYTITVTDTETQQVQTYFNPQDTMASFSDTSAFP